MGPRSLGEASVKVDHERHSQWLEHQRAPRACDYMESCAVEQEAPAAVRVEDLLPNLPEDNRLEVPPFERSKSPTTPAAQAETGTRDRCFFKFPATEYLPLQSNENSGGPCRGEAGAAAFNRKKQKVEAEEKMPQLDEPSKAEWHAEALEEELLAQRRQLKALQEQVITMEILGPGGSEAVRNAPKALIGDLPELLPLMDVDAASGSPEVYAPSDHHDTIEYFHRNLERALQPGEGDMSSNGVFEEFVGFSIRHTIRSVKAINRVQQVQRDWSEIAALLDFSTDQLRILAAFTSPFSNRMDWLRRERTTCITKLSYVMPSRYSAQSSAQAALQAHDLMESLTRNLEWETTLTCALILRFLQTATLQQIAQCVAFSYPDMPDFPQILRAALSAPEHQLMEGTP